MATPDTATDPVRFWYTLALTGGVGRALLRRVLDSRDQPRSLEHLASLVADRDPALARALRSPEADVDRTIDGALDWARDPAQHLISIDHPAYPALLRQIDDPPPVLHVRGSLDGLSRPMLAIVGSRQASLDGLRIARDMAAELGRCGLVIGSGLAAGIDLAAHRGAIEVGAPSIAVVGTGIDRCYPASHQGTADQIVEQAGAVVSELPLGAPPLPHHFPRRNRLIAGLARGVLVVQAARRSGSLITARLALDYGRDVLAVPGSIHSSLHKGCHQLIREGAALVESAADVLAALFGPAPMAQPDLFASRPASVSPSISGGGLLNVARDGATGGLGRPAGHSLLDRLGWSPIEPDRIALAAGLGPGETAQLLLELELEGLLERLADGRLQRRTP
jgi:DNA processing protein